MRAGASSRGGLLALAFGGVLVSVLIAVTGTVMAILGGEIACVGGGGQALASPPTAAAEKEIPPQRLRIYQAAGRRIDIEWSFLAAIGEQECGSGECAGVNASGCAGPMQIAYVRESPCSPGPGPTIWEMYRLDGDGDGVRDIDNRADAVFTAARILREAKGAPPTGGSYAEYREAACGYYGACGDSVVSYADEVMARAVSYGFPGMGAPAGPGGLATGTFEQEVGGCVAGADQDVGPLGPAVRAFAPRQLAPLPHDVSAWPGIECDARIVPGVVYLARRFGVLVTSCYAPSGHEATGEHPLGAAIDAGPKGSGWSGVERLARWAGWRPACAASGVAPTCARPPFRFVGYNGFPHHGDPAHCNPCGGGPHIHISWNTSASPGQPESRARYGYEPASWIEVFSATSAHREERRKSPERRGDG